MKLRRLTLPWGVAIVAAIPGTAAAQAAGDTEPPKER